MMKNTCVNQDIEEGLDSVFSHLWVCKANNCIKSTTEYVLLFNEAKVVAWD